MSDAKEDVVGEGEVKHRNKGWKKLAWMLWCSLTDWSLLLGKGTHVPFKGQVHKAG